MYDKKIEAARALIAKADADGNSGPINLMFDRDEMRAIGPVEEALRSDGCKVDRIKPNTLLISEYWKTP